VSVAHQLDDGSAPRAELGVDAGIARIEGDLLPVRGGDLLAETRLREPAVDRLHGPPALDGEREVAHRYQRAAVALAVRAEGRPLPRRGVEPVLRHLEDLEVQRARLALQVDARDADVGELQMVAITRAPACRKIR
jgi:hypothetical protein